MSDATLINLKYAILGPPGNAAMETNRVLYTDLCVDRRLTLHKVEL